MKKLLLIASLLLSATAFAQDYPYAQDYFYISDSNWTLMTQFPQEGKGTLNVYFNGLTYLSGNEGDETIYTAIGDMKGPFFGTSNSKNAFYADENGNNVCIAFQNQETGFSYTNGKIKIQNAITVASIDYDSKKITLSKAENIEITINGVIPFVSPIALQAPEGVSVYEYDSYSDGELSVKLVKDGQIQPNTPVILKSDESKLYVFDFVNENSYNYYEVVKIQNPSQGKPVYFPDVNNEVIYGVQSPHFIPVGGYEFSNGKFTKVETKNSALVNSFSCYLMLPEETDAPDSIEIVFPVEKYYLHYTDEDGNYLSTFQGASDRFTYLWDNDKDGTYELEHIEFEPNKTTYFVISAYPGPANVDTDDNIEEEQQPSADVNGKNDDITYMAPEKNNSWSGFVGKVYGEENGKVASFDPNDEYTAIPFKFENTTSNKVSRQINFTPLTADGQPGTLEYTTNGIGTGIDAVTVVKADDKAVYNVFGQRVDENYKGIVIKNGKKFIQR